MTIETYEQYREALERLGALADESEGMRDEAEFLNLTEAMVAYEAAAALGAEK